MIEEAKKECLKTATFVGELRIRYKQCLDEESKNNWCVSADGALTDEEQKVQQRSSEILSCQINLEVRYLECGQKTSAFNADGSLKPKKPKYGTF